MSEPRPRGRPRAFHDKTEQNTVQSLDRALSILEVVAESSGLTLTELAQAADQSAATAYRVLTTFQSHGFVELETESQRWHIGAGAFRTGSAFLRRTKLADRARGAMESLMRETGETANLGIEDRGEVLFLTQVETHEAIRAFFPPGTRSPMHVSGIGKALLAHMPMLRLAEVMARGLRGFTPASLIDAQALERDLIATRARGYAIDNEERTEGMRCIAAPIFDAQGRAVAGLSISGPVFRLSLERAEEVGAMVKRAAQGVTEATGGRGV
ncbi:MAG: IclR family transcriptional regulator [Natronohydrobacter sp.]|nr:IclR family transcriptional regulator [Natronohydrobacter sp.]